MLATAVCGGISLVLTPSARADFNLVQNGNFTSTTTISAGNPSSASGGQLNYNIQATGWATTGYNFVFASGAAAANGVNSTYGNLSLWGANTFGATTVSTALATTPVPGGGSFLGADGAYDVGAITQTINGLTAGHVYDVSFYYAAAQQKGDNYKSPTTETWTVKLGSSSKNTPTLSLPGEESQTAAANNFSGWIQDTMAFTASGTSEVLSFLASGTPSGEPPFSLLADVSVVAAPEPSSLAGAGLVVLALGFGSWRMFRKPKQA